MKKVPAKSHKTKGAPKSDDTVELLHFVVANMATKDDIANMATKDELAQIRAEMATKDDLAEFRKEVHEDMQEMRDDIAEIKVDIRYIKAEIADIRGVLENIKGYRKEIDYALERIARIERHLGLGSTAKRALSSKR